MFAWLSGIFTKIDRQEAAWERAAIAAESFADDMEAVRDAFRDRLEITVHIPKRLPGRPEEPARINRRKPASS